MSLVIKQEVKTFDLTIRIDCPAATGTFVGVAKIKSKPENKALFERISNEGMEDEEVLREIYETFKGLPCDPGKEFDYLLNGPISAYLVPAALQAYLEQYNQARVGNSRPSRAR
ncbi:tail assembly chaperone [Microcystis phage Me-ZS1]|nr:tail assembly chaperone [Microcystis phage Me-ZS1]